MGVKKATDSDFESIILDPNNYEEKINKIEIPHERAMRWNGALTGEGANYFAIGTSEIDADCADCATGRDLRRIDRREKRFLMAKRPIRWLGMKISPKMKKSEIPQKERKILGTCQVLKSSTSKSIECQ